MGDTTRWVDVLTPQGEAIESKVGYRPLGKVERGQIASDQQLLQSKRVSGVRWIFQPNEWGEVGPSGPLARALEDAGFRGKYGARREHELG